MKKILFILWAWASQSSWIPTFTWFWAKPLFSDIISWSVPVEGQRIFFEYGWWINYINQWIKFFNYSREVFNKQPNDIHLYIETLLSQLDKFNIKMINQNIDNLDKNFNIISPDCCIKIHGDIFLNRCSNNYKHNIRDLKHRLNLNPESQERCSLCNSKIIPDIIYCDEKYREYNIHRISQWKKEKLDCVILIGTSLKIKYILDIANSFRLKSEHCLNLNLTESFPWFENINTLKELQEILNKIN